jgi:hypothetical protein
MMADIYPMNCYLLNHDLSAYPPFHPDRREVVPAGVRIIVAHWDHSETDSLIEWDRRTLLVDKDSLISFTVPI